MPNSADRRAWDNIIQAEMARLVMSGVPVQDVAEMIEGKLPGASKNARAIYIKTQEYDRVELKKQFPEFYY